MKTGFNISKMIDPRYLAFKATKCLIWFEANYQIDGVTK
jgi:hypothetical protein